MNKLLREWLEERMVLVSPVGDFLMGEEFNPDPPRRVVYYPTKVHRVTLESPFYMDQTPVTVEEFRKFFKEIGYGKIEFPPETPQSWKEGIDTNPFFIANDSLPDSPQVFLRWFDALHYLNWRSEKCGLEPYYGIKKERKLVTEVYVRNPYGFRLPTEAEWEYAARGGLEQKMYPWGDEPGPYSISPHFSVKRVPPQTFWNGKELFALLGQPSEWTNTNMSDYPYKAGDGREDLDPTKFKVLRGVPSCIGCCVMRVAARNAALPQQATDGFRGVITLPNSYQK